MIATERQHSRRICSPLGLFALLAITACCRKREPSPYANHGRLTPGVILYDITFRSASLGRDIQYRVISPTQPARPKLPAVYLLHGGEGFRDWPNYSELPGFAESGLILIMPEGESSCYTNAVDPPQDRFEDYVTHDLITDVETRFPVVPGRAGRAVIGMSMGGFGAVKIALRHPDLLVFAGGISSVNARFRGNDQASPVTTTRSLVPRETRADATMILSFWPGVCIPKTHRTFSSPAGSKRAYYPRIGSSPHCSASAISTTSFTPYAEAITGTSGTRGCQLFLGAWWNLMPPNE